MHLQTGGTLSSLSLTTYNFKEPFISWAAEEIVKGDLTEIELSYLLLYNYPEKAKKKAFESFLSSLPQQISFKANSLEAMVSLAVILRSMEGAEKYAHNMYLRSLEDRILSDPNIMYLNSEYMISILYLAPSAQKGEIARRILYNNPRLDDLYYIVRYNIDPYSYIAESMIKERENINLDLDRLRSSDLVNLRSRFLQGKMENK